MARIKLARLLESEGTLSNDEAARPGTFEEAALRIVARAAAADRAAGVVRPAPGFEQATTDAERRKLCLIQSGSTERRPLDLQSFRCAYNAALADANVNVQTAMRLAGHRNASTHMHYVMRTGRLAAPTAALPTLRNEGTAVPILIECWR